MRHRSTTRLFLASLAATLILALHPGLSRYGSARGQDSAPDSSLSAPPDTSLIALAHFDSLESQIRQLDESIELLGRWRTSQSGPDSALILQRKDVRLTRRLSILWNLAEIAPQLPPDSAVARLAELGQLLSDELERLRGRLVSLVQKASMLRAGVADLSPSARVEREQEIARLDRQLNDFLREYHTTLLHAEDRGAAPEGASGLLDDALMLRAEILAARIEMTADEIDEARDRTNDTNRAEMESEIGALTVRSERALSALKALLDLMDERQLATTEYRQILVASTGQLTVETLDVGVIQGLISEWWNQAAEWVSESGANALFRLVIVLLIVFAFSLLARVLRRIMLRALQSSNVELTTLFRETIIRWTTRVVLLIGLLIALSQLGVELAPLLAGLGVAGFIIGFALQDTLSNFAAGVMILLYRPFDVDDVVEAGGVFGKVAAMSLVSTTFLSFDNQRYVVPNNKIWGDVIKNVTAQDVRRVDMVFGIGYADDIPKAERVLHEVVSQHELVLGDPEPVIKLYNLGDSSVDFIVRPWCKTADYWNVFWDITRAVKLRFDEEGVTIPFPQRDVHLYQEIVAAAPPVPGGGSPLPEPRAPSAPSELSERQKFEEPEGDEDEEPQS